MATKLEPKIRRDIEKSLREGKESKSAIAKKYGVSWGSVNNISKSTSSIPLFNTATRLFEFKNSKSHPKSSLKKVTKNAAKQLVMDMSQMDSQDSLSNLLTYTSSKTKASTTETAASSSKKVTSSTKKAASSSEKVISTIEQTALTIDNIATNIEKTASSSEKLISTIKQTALTIDNVATNIEKTASSSEKVINTIEQTAFTIDNVATNIEKTARSSEKVISTIEQAALTIDKAASSIEKAARNNEVQRQQEPHIEVFNSLSLHNIELELKNDNSQESNIKAMLSNFSMLCDNMHVVPHSLAAFLICFLLVLEQHKMPVLMLGPYSQHLINSYTSGYNNQVLSELTLGNSFNGAEFKKALDQSQSYTVLNNMFTSGFSDNALAFAHDANKHKGLFFWQYPYYEDLMIQPKGLFNFTYPLLTELFIKSQPPLNAQYYFSNKTIKIDQRYESIDFNLTNLGLSPLVLNNINSILNKIANVYLSLWAEELLPELSDDELNTNIELLFGIAPFAICLGKVELLKPYLNMPEVLNEIKASLKYFCS